MICLLKNKKKYILIFLIIISLFIFSGCSDNNEELPQAESSAFMMDTLIKMRAHGENAEKAVDESMKRIKEIEDLMSKTIESSEVYQINSNSGQKVNISDDTELVLEKSLYYAELTEGKFDPTVGRLVELWGIGTENAKVPTEEEINEALNYVGHNKLHLYEDQAMVEDEVELDLGGIAKGYAADEVRRISENNNIPSAFVNLGGNVLVIGRKVDGTKWRVGIQDPRQGRGNVMAIIECEDKTIVTSGNYERYFEKDDTIYHHILNPDTGYPAQPGLLSVSIISENSFDADALSTSVFIMGLENGMNFIENLDEVEVMFITDELDVYLSSGLGSQVEITDDNFNLIEGENFAN